MDAVDRKRANTPYAHTNCSEECRKRGDVVLALVLYIDDQYLQKGGATLFVGCETLWSLDGNRKVTYPICMYQVPKSAPFGGKLQYVSSCPKQPVPRMAFCVEHCKMARKQNIPVDLHGYLRFCNNCPKESTPKTSDQAQPQETATDCQGVHFNFNFMCSNYVCSVLGVHACRDFWID